VKYLQHNNNIVPALPPAGQYDKGEAEFGKNLRMTGTALPSNEKDYQTRLRSNPADEPVFLL